MHERRVDVEILGTFEKAGLYVLDGGLAGDVVVLKLDRCGPLSIVVGHAFEVSALHDLLELLGNRRYTQIRTVNLRKLVHPAVRGDGIERKRPRVAFFPSANVHTNYHRPLKRGIRAPTKDFPALRVIPDMRDVRKFLVNQVGKVGEGAQNEAVVPIWRVESLSAGVILLG